jgi:hypothetical protein
MFGDRRPRFADVTAVVALVAALCGGAYAAGLGKNTVGSKQLKKGAVKTKKLADAAVTSSKLAEGSVTSPKVADGSIEAQDLAPGAIPTSDGYTKAESDDRFLPRAGTTVLQAAPTDWQSTNAAFNGNVAWDGTGISLSSGSVTNASVSIAPTLPVELAGQPQRVTAVNVCYNTVNVAELSQVRLNLTENTTGSGSTSSPVVDSTTRTDAACRDYIPPSPIELTPTANVWLSLSVNFPGGGGQSFIAGRATFTLTPA